MADTNEVRVGKIWTCKIGEHRPDVANPDQVMRNAVRDAYRAVTDCEPRFIFSGWGGELTKGERAVVEDREPVREATTPADAALDNVHSCSYYCHLPQCINRQRDELREKYFAALDDLEYHKQAAADANEQLNALRRSIENGTEQ